jgi:hypothetical protein
MSLLTTISPLGLLTAMAIDRGARIITPSITAWPPMFIFAIIASLFMGSVHGSRFTV